MSSTKNRRFKNTKPETDGKLEQHGFSRTNFTAKRMVECKQFSCKKVVDEQYTRQGYCLACVETAKRIKAQRAILAAIRAKETAFYDNNDFGVF